MSVPYFHVVFTLPQQLAPLALQNKRVVYGILFRAASETLLEVAADPKRMGTDIGFLAVLHSWGQNLQHHQEDGQVSITPSALWRRDSETDGSDGSLNRRKG